MHSFLFLDRNNACLAWEALGEYEELYYNDAGESQSRNWRTTGFSQPTRYPRAWVRYFTRPVVYFSHPTGTYFIF